MNTIPIPKEHGAYVVLIASWLLGLLHAPSHDPLAIGLSLILILSTFLMQEPLRPLFRARSPASRAIAGLRTGWLGLLLTIAIVSAAWLLLLCPATAWIVAAGVLVAIAFLLLIRRRVGLVSLSTAGFFALALAAPLARLASGPGASAAELVGLWLFAALFFAGSSACVRLRMNRQGGVSLPIAAHLLFIAAAAVLVGLGLLPAIALLAGLPALARLLWVVGDLPRYRRTSLKRIGLIETAVALLFLAINSAG
jgi:hypothetical protein